MTREQAKELLPIIQAFVESKKIEYSNDVKIGLRQKHQLGTLILFTV